MKELLKVSTGLTGKMAGMTVITSSMLHNENCAKLSKMKGSVCEHCYSQRALSYRANVRECYEKNGKILSTDIIPENELPYINSAFCRLESHGDLINETHLVNYIRLAEKNPHCTFAMWTKNYRVLLTYFRKGNLQPQNMQIVLSSPMLNKEMNLAPFERIGLRVKSFTVYDKEAAEQMDINCGGRKCIECRRCYASADKYIREKLK